MRSTKGVVTVTKGERKSAEGTKGESGTENVNRQRRKNVGGIERIAAPRDRERVRGKEREGIIFAREGCAVRHAAAQNHPLRPAPLRAFSSLFLALLAVLFFFFPPGRRRGARAAFHPRGPRRFFFSSVCAATPPRHNGRVPENSSLGRRPFPRPPRLFRRFPSRLNPLSRAPPSPSASPLALPPMPFFLSLFLSRPPPSASTCRRRRRRSDHPPSPSLACSLHSSASPQGCILRDPSNQPLPLPAALRRDTFVRCYIRYLRRVMYAPVFGRVFTRPLFDDRLCLMLNETRRSYYRSIYCFTLFRRNVALETVSYTRLDMYVCVFN